MTAPHDCSTTLDCCTAALFLRDCIRIMTRNLIAEQMTAAEMCKKRKSHRIKLTVCSLTLSGYENIPEKSYAKLVEDFKMCWSTCRYIEEWMEMFPFIPIFMTFVPIPTHTYYSSNPHCHSFPCRTFPFPFPCTPLLAESRRECMCGWERGRERTHILHRKKEVRGFPIILLAILFVFRGLSHSVNGVATCKTSYIKYHRNT